MKRLAVIVLMALAAAGCQAVKPDPAAVSASHKVYEQLRTGQDAAVLAQLPPQLNTPATAATLIKLRAMLPPVPPRSEHFTGSNQVDAAEAGRSIGLTVEYDYADRTAQFSSNFTEPPGTHGWRLQGFHLQVATHKELAVNDFDIWNKPVVDLPYLAFAIASPILMIVALVKVIRTKGLRRKWLWGVLAFVGVFSFHVNWTTGQLDIVWLTIQVIGAGMVRASSAFAPWVLTATLPLGAILILTGVWANPARARKKDPPGPSPASGDTAPSPGP